MVNMITDGNAWLTCLVNTMYHSRDKSKDGVAPKIFHKNMEEFTTVKIDSGRFSGVKLFNHSFHVVKPSLKGISKMIELTALTP